MSARRIHLASIETLILYSFDNELKVRPVWLLVESQSEDMEQLESIIAKLNKYTLSEENPLTSIVEIAKDYYDEHKKD